MDYLQEELDKYQAIVHSLHFLLTEKETEQSKADVFNVFDKAILKIVDILKIYLKKEYEIEADGVEDVFKYAKQVKLFNDPAYETIEHMIFDLNNYKQKVDPEIYLNIKNDYARILQILHDILRRMGEEAEEDEDN